MTETARRRDTFLVSGNGESLSEEQPTRCWLRSFPVAARVFDTANGKPILAVDIGKDGIQVWDGEAVVASAGLAQASATPAKRKWNSYLRTTLTVPVLVVCVPGMQRLTIGCLEAGTRRFSRGEFTFAWRGSVPLEENDPKYWVTGADWLTLVEKFGLTPLLENKKAKRVKGYPWGSGAASPNA